MAVSSKIILLRCYTVRLVYWGSPFYPEEENKQFLRNVGVCIPERLTSHTYLE